MLVSLTAGPAGTCTATTITQWLEHNPVLVPQKVVRKIRRTFVMMVVSVNLLAAKTNPYNKATKQSQHKWTSVPALACTALGTPIGRNNVGHAF